LHRFANKVKLVRKGGQHLDDFIFDGRLKSFFLADSGAGSKITAKDEASKRQLTVARHERLLLLKYHPDIPIGALGEAEKRGEKVLFRFRLFPTGQLIDLKINFPKPGKNELRLYFNDAVFSPKAWDNWFLFEQNAQIWIGSLDDNEIKAARAGAPIDWQNGFDQAVEEAYQEAVNTKLPVLVPTSSLKYRRDPKVAIAAMGKSGNVCEMMPKHETFISRATGAPYLEAHHFIPMMEQRHIDVNLDVVENICILNPYAHRMLHHATYSEIEPYLKELAGPREDFLKHIGVSVDRILRSYGRL
jgi:5-methylcytosine-specific restriction protein A